MMGRMETAIVEWLKRIAPGFSYNGAASLTGLSYSSVRRHLLDEGKNGSTPETVVAICRAYEINPLEGLIELGLIDEEEIHQYAAENEFDDALAEMPLPDLFKRLRNELEHLEDRAVDRNTMPLPGQMSLFDQLPVKDDDPAMEVDYSKIGDPSAYGLAANKGEQQIGHDELPNEP